MQDDLETQFDAAMKNIYKRAKSEANYNASRFLQMLATHSGLDTAKLLLHSATVSEGYTSLWERGRLDLTVEALVLTPQWQNPYSQTRNLSSLGKDYAPMDTLFRTV